MDRPPSPRPTAPGGPARRALLTTALAGAAALALPGPAHATAPTAGRHPAPHRAADEAAAHRLVVARWRALLLHGVAPGRPAGEWGEAYDRAVAARDRTARAHLAALDISDEARTPWPDLPMSGTEAPSSHLTTAAGRLRTVALAAAEGGSLHADPAVPRAVAAGLRVWWRAGYHAGRAQHGNWWDWEIGAPRAAVDLLVLLGAAVDEETRDGVLAAVDHFVPDPRRMLRDELPSTGANRVDLCRIVALRGASGGASERLDAAAHALRGVLDPVRVGDGFHRDGSFLMHTSVAYPGTYGQVLLKGVAELLRVLAGTPWAVAPEERHRAVDAVDRTLVPLVHAGLTTDAVRGRAIARHTATDADDGFRLALDLVTLADGLTATTGDPDIHATAARLRGRAGGWLTANTWRPLHDREPAQIATAAAVLAERHPEPPPPTGHFGFPDMERYVHRRPRWSYVLSLNSDRVARYEYMNGENAHGWHTGDGAALLYLDHDPQQYTDAFWPTADPKRLPGTTVDTVALPVGAGGDNDHEPLTGTRWSGEVRLGELALAAADLRGTDSPLRVRRSWLFLDDAVVCAASDLHAPGRTVETTVDHRSLHDPAAPTGGALRVDGRRVRSAVGTTVRHPSPRWAHLGGTGGYVFLPAAGAGPGAGAAAGALLTRTEDRTGSWSRIREGGPATPITRRFATLWHDHGPSPAGAVLAHLLLPGASPGETAARAADPGVRPPVLTPRLHAFRTTRGALPDGATLTGLVFFRGGTAPAADDAAHGTGAATADGPCAVLLRETPHELTVAVADPSRTAPVVRLRLDRSTAIPHRGVREADAGVTVLTADPDRVELLVETGGSHGATRTVAFGGGRPPARRRVRLIAAEATATVRAGRLAGRPSPGPDRLSLRRADTADGTAHALLRFAMPPDLPERGVERAVLWVFGTIPKDPDSRAADLLQHPLRAYAAVPDDLPWDEATVTWRSAPRPGAPLGEGWLTTYPDWVGSDVTAAFRGSLTAVTLLLAQDAPGPLTELAGRTAARPDRRPLLQVVHRA
ncbi:polysaccharide lyase family 8 super-sandwich domain-containing protein [Streptomyces bohaiensis]|uniref:polysaccharide lyase family 8 super-sandwich domain-containing protein n=1 Tax=Streptomyces bohaiensis TaxID=1431344 RepID=UPI003B78BC25